MGSHFAPLSGAIAAAALWVSLQVAADISVTNILMVPTFADEIHTQFTMGDKGATARTLLLTLPMVTVTWILLLALVPMLERSLPPLQLGYARLSVFRLGRSRWYWYWACLMASAGFVFLPLLAFVWKLGLAGRPPSWSAWNAGHQFVNEAGLYRCRKSLGHLGVALLTGMLAAGVAVIASWSARDSRLIRSLLLGLATLAWVLPAPVVGIGLKGIIMALMRWDASEPLADALYYGPSPLPDHLGPSGAFFSIRAGHRLAGGTDGAGRIA